MNGCFGLRRWRVDQVVSQMQSDDAVEPTLWQQPIKQELATIADAAIVDLNQYRALGGQNELAVANPEIDPERGHVSQRAGALRSAALSIPACGEIGRAR